MKKIGETITDWIWYLITLPGRFAFTMGIFILLLFKRTIPKWLKEKYLSQTPPRPEHLDPPTPYRK